MLAEFKHTLRRMRGQIIGWGIGLTAYGLLMVSLFDSIVNIEGFEELIASYPPELLAFFGDMMAITTPKGYVDIYYFNYMPVIIGIFMVGAGAGLLVGHEEKGILDLLMAYPISRTAFFWGRLLGLAVATIVLLAIGWLSWFLPSGSSGMELTWIELLRPFVPLFAQLLLWGVLALLLSLVLPAARLAGMLTGGLLVGNYLLTGLANSNEDLEAIVRFTPLHYYQGGRAIDGLNWEWLAGLAAATVIFGLLSWWRFQQRDIRVGGEGSWQLPSFRRLLRRGVH